MKRIPIPVPLWSLEQAAGLDESAIVDRLIHYVALGKSRGSDYAQAVRGTA
jgi:hypothetical protein